MKWPVYSNGIHPHKIDEPCSSRCLSTGGTVEVARCNYGHTMADHERAGACERPGLGTVYGIRPHLPMTPLEARQMSVTYKTTEINRPAVELLFHWCLECRVDLGDCTCHDDGKGMN